MDEAARDRKSEQGATATEYALLAAFIAFTIFVAVGFFGSQLGMLYDNMGGQIDALFP